MNKYYAGISGYYGDVERVLLPDESIIWKGAPKKSAFVLNASAKLMPLALMWLIFDSTFIINLLWTRAYDGMLWFMIPFFVIHLFPVWIWLARFFMAMKKWKSTEYVITDKRVLIRNGLLGEQWEIIDFMHVSYVSIQTGTIDRMLGVGDVYLLMDNYLGNTVSSPAILDIVDYQNVCTMIQECLAQVKKVSASEYSTQSPY